MIPSPPHSPGWSMDGSCWVTRSPGAPRGGGGRVEEELAGRCWPHLLLQDEQLCSWRLGFPER